MTLMTAVHLDGITDADTAFDLALTAILAASGKPDPAWHRQAVTTEPLGWTDGHRSTPLQGLPAIITVMPTDGSNWTPVYDTGKPGDGYESDWFRDHKPGCVVSWDTNYGYSNAAGMNVGDLHATAVAALIRLTADTASRVTWRLEYDRSEHDGRDNLDRLGRVYDVAL